MSLVNEFVSVWLWMVPGMIFTFIACMVGLLLVAFFNWLAK